MISKELQIKLKSKFNPEGSLLRQHQLRMLYILDVVAKLCDQAGIQYWLTHGTLLGAVRHGGFIPWDDDLDICIFRRDIKRFRKLMINNLPNDLVLQCHQTDKNYYHPYLKIRDLNSEMQETGDEDLNYLNKGIYIDVFPVEKSHLSLVKYSYILWGRILYKHILPNRVTVFRLVLNTLSYSFFTVIFGVCRMLDSILPSKKWNLPYGCFIVTAPGGFEDNDIIQPHVNELVVFEGRFFSCPNDVDSYLRKCYGDYNKLPKTDEIEPHINGLKIWGDTSAIV